MTMRLRAELAAAARRNIGEPGQEAPSLHPAAHPACLSSGRQINAWSGRRANRHTRRRWDPLPDVCVLRRFADAGLCSGLGG